MQDKECCWQPVEESEVKLTKVDKVCPLSLPVLGPYDLMLDMASVSSLHPAKICHCVRIADQDCIWTGKVVLHYIQ